MYFYGLSFDQEVQKARCGMFLGRIAPFPFWNIVAVWSTLRCPSTPRFSDLQQLCKHLLLMASAPGRCRWVQFWRFPCTRVVTREDSLRVLQGRGILSPHQGHTENGINQDPKAWSKHLGNKIQDYLLLNCCAGSWFGVKQFCLLFKEPCWKGLAFNIHTESCLNP